ncbi:MAG: hypothetical protein ACOX6T_27390 [Myxococcales bacterium]|jgi:hypothetical protein
MSVRAKAEHGVNRLIDIVVEEVSLVDRAANKHRFLIVKRSNDMDATTTDDAATTADATEEVQDLAAEVEEEESSGEAAESAGAESPLGSALAALEGLTEAVELLGTAGDEGAKPRLAELASELKTVSDRLAGLAGAKPEDGAATGAARSDGTPAAGEGEPLAAAVASVRATLERVSAVLDAAGKDGDGATRSGQDDSAGDSGADGAGDDKVAGQLEALATALRTLTETVKEQQQRLGRIEKRFGLPNSAPSGERPAKPDDEDIGWPLDLNRPFDRESVDKATSFHDL